MVFSFFIIFLTFFLVVCRYQSGMCNLYHVDCSISNGKKASILFMIETYGALHEPPLSNCLIGLPRFLYCLSTSFNISQRKKNPKKKLNLGTNLPFLNLIRLQLTVLLFLHNSVFPLPSLLMKYMGYIRWQNNKQQHRQIGVFGLNVTISECLAQDIEPMFEGSRNKFKDFNGTSNPLFHLIFLNSNFLSLHTKHKLILHLTHVDLWMEFGRLNIYSITIVSIYIKVTYLYSQLNKGMIQVVFVIK